MFRIKTSQFVDAIDCSFVKDSTSDAIIRIGWISNDTTAFQYCDCMSHNPRLRKLRINAHYQIGGMGHLPTSSFVLLLVLNGCTSNYRSLSKRSRCEPKNSKKY